MLTLEQAEALDDATRQAMEGRSVMTVVWRRCMASLPILRTAARCGDMRIAAFEAGRVLGALRLAEEVTTERTLDGQEARLLLPIWAPFCRTLLR